MKRIGVAVVVEAETVLVGVRPEGTVLAGMYEFPGGKCEPDESPAACAIRECLEETGLQIDIGESLLHCQHSYDHGDVDLTFFLCSPVEKIPPAAPFRWVPIREISGLNFPAGNRGVIDKLLSRYGEQDFSVGTTV